MAAKAKITSFFQPVPKPSPAEGDENNSGQANQVN